MRSATQIQLLLSTIGAIALAEGHNQHARRQIIGLPVGEPLENLETLPVVSRERLTPKLSSDAIRERIRWGPLDLTAVDPHQGHNTTIDEEGDDFVLIPDGLCKDCTIIYGSTVLTYENFGLADIGTGVYNHHMVIGDVGKPPTTFFACQNGTNSPPTPTPSTGHEHLKAMADNFAVQIFGSGHDGSGIDYWDASGELLTGFYVARADTLVFFATLVNYKEYKQQVYLTTEYEYIEGKPDGLADSTVSSMSVVGCGETSQGYFPPANQSSTVYSPEYVVTTPGTMLNLIAHLHDGGVNVRLHVNGEQVCQSDAIYGEDSGSTEIDGTVWETITSYTRCSIGIEVKEGDIMTIDGTYDLAKHPLRPGAHDHSMSGEAMAMMATIFAPAQN